MIDKTKPVRHILALSGGKDSAALAVYLSRKVPNLEYVFLDTGHELPETYEYLENMRALLGIEITRLSSRRDFDFWLGIYNGCLPSPQNRWCTRELKIRPYERYIGSDQCISYIALRADENRIGYISGKANIIPRYPFIMDDLCKSDIMSILDDSGLGLPSYYEWRSRSGCYFCFFQRLSEYVALNERHPDLFLRASKYETDHSDGRTYTWVQGTTLRELLSRRAAVLSEAAEADLAHVGKRSRLREKLSEVHFSLPSNCFLNLGSSRIWTSDQTSEEDSGCLICTL